MPKVTNIQTPLRNRHKTKLTLLSTEHASKDGLHVLRNASTERDHYYWRYSASAKQFALCTQTFINLERKFSHTNTPYSGFIYTGTVRHPKLTVTQYIAPFMGEFNPGASNYSNVFLYSDGKPGITWPDNQS